MVLDEKEAEAEAHKAEKDALWRRVQDIATRVAVLEQKSAEARSPGQDQDEHAAGEGNDLFGFASPEQISPRSSHSGAEDANLRAKNDVLKRKVDIMREQLEETKLELSTARNGQLYYRRASLQSYGGSSRSPSPTLCPNKRLEHGSAPASSDGAPGRVVAFPIVGSTLTPPRTAGVSTKVSPHARPAAEENHVIGSVSFEDKIDMIDNCKSKKDLEGFEDEIEIPQRKDMTNNLDASRLLEHNASLMMELDSKNDLIEALRQQLLQQQYMTQQRGTRGRCTFFPRHAMEELGEAGSDDDCGDENEKPNPEVHEQSFMDKILNEAGGNPAFVMPPPLIDAAGTDDSENLKEEPWGAGRIQPVDPERRRSFGGVVPENIPLVISSRKGGMHETEKIADWDRKRVHQGKIPHKAGREKSPFRGNKHSSSSPPRRHRRSLDRARGRAPSTVALSRHEADFVTGVVDQSITVAAASPLDPVMAGALETWPASPRGVPLSWSSAMRALAAVARVGGQQQQQPEPFDVRTAELDIVVDGQQASAPSEKSIHVPIILGSVKENVAVPKNDVEDKVTPQEEHVLASLASAKLEVAKKSLMDTHMPTEEDGKLSSGVEQESAILASVNEEAAMEVQEVEDDEFPTVEKHESLSSEFILKPQAAMTKMVKGAQALDVEDDMLSPVVVKGDEPSPEEEQAQTLLDSAEPDTMVIGEAKVVGKPLSPTIPRRRCRSFELARGPDPSQAASPMQEVEGVTALLRQSLTIDAAPTLAPILALTDGALETWPASPRGVPLSWSSAMRALAAVARVEGQQQQQLGGSEVEMAKLDVAVERQEASSFLRSVKKESVAMKKSEVEKVQAPVTVREDPPTSAFPSAGGDESISPESAKPKEANIRETEVEDVQSPPTSSDQSAKLEAMKKTLVDAQAKAFENQLSSAEAVKGDDFFTSKKQSSTSPEITVKREAAVIEIVQGGQAIDVEKDMVPSKKSQLPLKEARGVQEPPEESDNCFSANSQEPTSLEGEKPKVVVKEETEGSQSPPAGEGDERLLAEELTSPAAVKERIVGLSVPAMDDGKFPAVDGLEPTCPESVKPKAAIAKLEDTQVVPAIGNEISSSALKQESTSQASVMTEAAKEGKKIEDAMAPTVEVKGFPFSAQGQAPTSPAPVMEKVWNDQEPGVEGRTFSSAKVQSSTSQASVKTQPAVEEREIVGIKMPAVTVHGLPTEDQLSPISPASAKLEDKAGGIQRPVAKGQEKPARPSGTEKTQPLPMAIAGGRDVARNRAEQKSRQAMAKLGLRAVSGVSRVTMKASNGDLLVVEKPDVFKHPQQSTYVIFGVADMKKPVSGGRSHHPTARRAGAEAFLKPTPTKCAPREVEVLKNLSGADRVTVEDRSASAGIDPADVLSVMSHTGCVSDAAIEALRKEGGDVVNAVMYLTEA